MRQTRSELYLFDFPDMRKASIHGDKNRFARATYNKKQRQIARLIGLSGRLFGLKKAWIQYRFFVKDNRMRDAANLVQAMKPVIDGLIDAGVVIGDHWQVLEIGGVSVQIDRERPRVEIIIGEI